MSEERLRSAAWAALSAVRDPELDQPLTDLGFVSQLTVDCGAAYARIRLPTYFCAPNFAYLMVADARDALEKVPGIQTAHVQLDDHFAADEINAGVTAGRGFAATFPGLARSELTDLRRTFQRKAHHATTERLCRVLLSAGRSVDELSRMRLGELADSPQLGSRDQGRARDLERLRRLRAALGLPNEPGDPLLVDDSGRPIPAESVRQHLDRGRATRVSMEGNAGLCRSLLHTRYRVS